MRSEIAGAADANSRGAGRASGYGERGGHRYFRCAQNARAGLARCNPEERLQTGANRRLGIKERIHTTGCCWVRQWKAPRPQINSVQSIGMIRRCGKIFVSVASATVSFGSLKVGSKTHSFAM